MARGRVYSDDAKAAVLAALLEGQSVNQAAKAYEVPVGTVKRWKANLKRNNEPSEPQNREEIGDLLVGYLRENLETLRVQSRHFRDTAWLYKQSAADAAVLHGVLADKTVRLLEALEGAGEEG